MQVILLYILSGLAVGLFGCIAIGLAFAVVLAAVVAVSAVARCAYEFTWVRIRPYIPARRQRATVVSLRDVLARWRP